jgi:hypothetical protein
VVNTGHAESLDRRWLAGFFWRRRPSDREPGDARDSRRSDGVDGRAFTDWLKLYRENPLPSGKATLEGVRIDLSRIDCPVLTLKHRPS